MNAVPASPVPGESAQGSIEVLKEGDTRVAFEVNGGSGRISFSSRHGRIGGTKMASLKRWQLVRWKDGGYSLELDVFRLDVVDPAAVGDLKSVGVDLVDFMEVVS